jgi:hypothetical protein
MIPGSANPLLMAAAQDTGYNVSRSLRFNAPDSAYLSRTPGSAGNRRTWTLSLWAKRSTLGAAYKMLFSAGSAANECSLRFTDSPADALEFYQYSGGGFNWRLVTTQVFRDPSAWYHIVAVVDSTQATSAERAKLYVNGAQVTTFGTASYPTQNYDSLVNSTVEHGIGRVSAAQYFDGLLAECHLIDGSALTPSSFAETNATTGQWVPKAYTGSYGTNGFKLDFSNNASTTTVSQDSSGNNNHWTANNISVTAGAGNDSLVDTPVSSGTDTGAGGEVKGNYCTFNPLDNGSAVLTNGNLDWDSIGNQGTRSTFFVSSGKWYWEITYNQSNLIGEHGVATRETQALTGGLAFPGAIATSWGFSNSSGNKSNNASFTNITGAGAQNDVVMVALDMDNGKIWWGRNGTWLGSGNPATGANAAFSNLANNTVAPMAGVGGADAGAVSYNFGARSWAYAAPSGFKALCTANLSAGTITTSGSFTGNANADGPFVWLNGVPSAMTINGNAVTFGTDADKLANGFKVRTNSISYNTSGSNTYSITTTGDKFNVARAQSNP